MHSLGAIVNNPLCRRYFLTGNRINVAADNLTKIDTLF